MKTELIETEKSTREVDWNKDKLVRHKNNKNFIMLVCNDNDDDGAFEGICIHTTNQNDYPLFKHSLSWSKSAFEPVTEPITIKFIP